MADEVIEDGTSEIQSTAGIVDNADADTSQWTVKANDIEFSNGRQYATNVISTSKYTPLTFLPLNLFVQLKRAANLYFVILLILQVIPQITSLSAATTAVPLALVLSITAFKDLYDDVKRHQSDNQVNNRTAFVVQPSSPQNATAWRNVRVGSIIRLSNNDFIAADMLLLSTSDSNGLCYVETAELDGETNLKVRSTLDSINCLEEADLNGFNGKIVCESPNNVLDKFEGTLFWHGQTLALDNNNLLLRGCKLRNTEWAYGVVIFAGHETKLMQNSGETKFKRTRLDHVMNILLIGIFCFLIFLCTVAAVLNSVFENNILDDLLVYIPRVDNEPSDPNAVATLQFFSFVILLNTLVPISLYVSVEFIRFGQSFMINWDRQMYYEVNDTPARARTTTLNEELGQIEYIFSDKTGTLTQNIMTFLKCTVGGKMYGHWEDASDVKTDGKVSKPNVIKVTGALPSAAASSGASHAAEASLETDLGRSGHPQSNGTGTLKSDTDTEHFHFTMEVDQVQRYGTVGEVNRAVKLPNAASESSGDLMPAELATLPRRTPHAELHGPETEPELHEAEPEAAAAQDSSSSAYEKRTKPHSPIDFPKATPYGEASFAHYDHTLLAATKEKSSPEWNFFHALSVCHSVMTETDTDSLVYQAQSPDEAALVSAARNFGLAFLERTTTSVTINEFGEQAVYDVLAILDFNNVRKRMSVIVRDSTGQVKLICKGADNVIFARLSDECQKLADTTQEHLNVFAQSGLRTLCIAYRDLSDKEWQEWSRKHHEANTSLTDRDDKLDDVYEDVEKNMTLIGASAIEDKLQDGVPDTIANLARANIKIWVLTGDKDETAINIGYSCRLLTNDMQVFLVDGDTEESVCASLTQIKRQIDDARSDYERLNNVSLEREDPFEDPEEAEKKPKFGIVINGYSLAPALNGTLNQLFLNTAILCRAVICCRVTPLQKANVVSLVKNNRKAVTLAIGDGANDVGMIKTAHIGVGISGQEGMQAVLSSDYSFAQFKYLQRLLLVHGRWSYMRMCKFLGYFFYKNFAFVLIQFWFNIFTGFTAQAFFDPWFITIYNVIFSSMPIIIVGVMDQDVNDKLCLAHPRLYIPGQQNLLFNKTTFAAGIAKGIFVSIIIYFSIYFSFVEGIDAWGQDAAGIFQMGACGSAILVVIVNFQIALDTYHWTWLNHFFTWGSIGIWFAYAFLVYAGPIYKSVPSALNDPGAALHLFENANFWFLILFNVGACLLPVLALRFLSSTKKPLLVDTIRANLASYMKVVEDKEQAAEQEVKDARRRAAAKHAAARLRQANFVSSGKHGLQGQMRSGYSFAYTPGFGDLIMSGKLKKGGGRATSSRGPSAMDSPAAQPQFLDVGRASHTTSDIALTAESSLET